MKILVCLCALVLSGCKMTSAHLQQMDMLRAMAADVTQRLEDGSVGQISASGQALNPGIVAEAAVVYRAVARYEGLGGQFSISAHGKLTDRQFSEQIFAIINDTTKTEQMRLQLVAQLLQGAK